MTATATGLVLFIGVGPDGCGWYRAIQPARALAATGARTFVADAGKIHGTFRGDEVLALHTPGDTILMQRPMLPRMPGIARCARAEGRRVVVELDDDVWSMAPHNPAARWFTPAALGRLIACCRLAHCVIASTAPLAARVRAVTGQREVVVIPNAVDPALAGPPRAEAAPLIVGWAGGASHRADFRVARPAVVRAAGRPGVEVHFCGDDPLCGPPPTPAPRAIHGWTSDMAGHYRNISTFHIGLAPVENSRFNRSKSALKWMEYALHGTAALLSKVPCYEGDARHGETALLAEDRHEWERALMRLIRDARLREELGGRARAEILARHTIAHRVPRYREVLGV